MRWGSLVYDLCNYEINNVCSFFFFFLFSATIQAISAYLDAFQKIADAATNSRGKSLLYETEFFWLHQVSVYWVHRRVWRVIVHCRLNGIRLVILITCSKTRTSRQPTWELKCFKAQCVCVWERERDRERESVLKLLVDIWKIKYVICRWVTKKIRSGTAKGRAANVWYYANPIRTSIKFELYFLVRLRGFFAIPNSSIPHCDKLYY